MHLIFSQGAFYVKALPAGPALKCDHAKPQIYSTHGIKEIALGVKKIPVVPVSYREKIRVGHRYLIYTRLCI
jgi:hypothetical protein